MTNFGGVSGIGNIFKYNPTTSVFTDLFDFTGPSANPLGNLIQASDGNLYGMTEFGGQRAMVTFSAFNPTTFVYADLFDFSGPSGSYNGWNPTGSLIQATDGNLYGMTQGGGVLEYGNIFSFNPTTKIFTDLVDFTGTSGSYIGAAPYGSLIQATDGNLYGMTYFGGTNDSGTIFKYDPTTTVFSNLVNFTGNTGSYMGANPHGDLMQASDGNLYGMTYIGGAHDTGNIFKYNPTTAVFTDMVDFTGTSGLYIGDDPTGSLIEYHTTTGIHQLILDDGQFTIYPNPSTGIFTFAFKQSTNNGDQTAIEVYNVLGERVYSQFKIQKQILNIDLRNQPNGVYLYRVLSENGGLIGEGKLIIQK